MSILKAAVHKLAGDVSAELTLKNTVLTDNAQLTELHQSIKTSFYNRSNKQYGVFDERPGYLKTLIRQWQKQNFDFLDLTQQIMENLKNTVSELKLAIDGHWYFAHEALEDGEYFWFFHLKHKYGINVTDELNLNSSQLIDYSKLGFGGVIDLDALQTNSSKYLTVSFGFAERQLQSTLLDVFSFVDTLNTAADTERFMEIVKAYSEHLPEEKGSQYRRKAVEYCTEQDKLGETVIASEMASAIVDSAESMPIESLTDYMAATQPDAKKEFIPDRKSLKKYLRYTGKSKEVSISFSNDMLGKQVTFNPQSETLTIKNLPAALLRQLKEAVDGGPTE